MGTTLAPISTSDIPMVADFMHRELNRKIPMQRWAGALKIPWAVEPPNHGFYLRDGTAVVGAYLAYYSQRSIRGRTERFCNLGAWCVRDGHRHQGLRLIMKLLAQPGYHFTDFSPSGNVVPLNRRLHFHELDTTTALIPNVPMPTQRGGLRVTQDQKVLLETLTGEERTLYLDHKRAAAVGHLLVQAHGEHCYVMFRRDTRKGVRAFASVLHVTNPELFRHAAPRVGSWLLTRHAVPATLVELRVAGGRPERSILLRSARPKMFRSDSLESDQVDYLYSELTCLAW